jgi:hypothetical protein
MDRNVTAVYRTYAVANLEDRRWMDELHDLHLPDDDLRTYQQCVRRGDYVVSANVDKDSVRRVQEIMRRPEAEAHNLDHRGDEFREDIVIARSDTTRAKADPRWVGRRDTEYTDPYVRPYKRDAPLGSSR